MLSPATYPLRAMLVLALVLCSNNALTQDSHRKIKNKVVPSYPELAKKLGIVGIVRLELTVAADGKIKAVTVKGGHPVLADAAEHAAEKWRYAPGAEEIIAVEMNFRPN